YPACNVAYRWTRFTNPSDSGGRPPPSDVRSRLVLGPTPWVLAAPRAGQVRFRLGRLRRGAGPPPAPGTGVVGKACPGAAPRPSSRLGQPPWQERFGPSPLLRGVVGPPPRGRPPGGTSGLLRPRLTSAAPSRPVARAGVRFARTGWEISQGKSCRFRPVLAGFTCVRVWMTAGRRGPLPAYPTTPALYPIPVRRARAQGHRLPSHSASRRTPSP